MVLLVLDLVVAVNLAVEVSLFVEVSLVVEVNQVVDLVDHSSVVALVSKAVVEALIFPSRKVEALVGNLEVFDLEDLVVVHGVALAVVPLNHDWVENSPDSLEATVYSNQECDSEAA